MLKPSSVLSIWTFFTKREDFQKMSKNHFYFSASLVNCPLLFGAGSKHIMLQKSLTWWLVWHKRNWETFCRVRSLIPASLPPVVSILIGRWSVGLQYVKQHCYWKVWDCQIVRHCWRVCWCISAHISRGQGDLAGQLCDLTNSFVDPLLQW